MKLSQQLADKASDFPEYSYGANQVTLHLQNGKEVNNVILAWASEIVKVGGKPVSSEEELPFSPPKEPSKELLEQNLFMPRVHRHYIPGRVWHVTHRCHKQEFLLNLESMNQ